MRRRGSTYVKIASSEFTAGWREGYSQKDSGRAEGMSDMSAESAEALSVLREIWRVQGQTAADLDEECGQKTCKKMDDAGVGFEDFAPDGDKAAAWRATLAREGKLSRSGGSVRDLVLGTADAP
jgi:uncharacterized protein (DUF2147 family)